MRKLILLILLTLFSLTNSLAETTYDKNIFYGPPKIGCCNKKDFTKLFKTPKRYKKTRRYAYNKEKSRGLNRKKSRHHRARKSKNKHKFLWRRDGAILCSGF